MENSGHGKVNLDDEDPDMDDWSDFDDDSIDERGSGDDEDGVAFYGADGKEDDFMDAPSSDEDFEGDVNDNFYDDDDDDDDDDDFPTILGDGEESSDDNVQGKESSTKKKKKFDSIYADADEYEKMLEEELNAAKAAPNRKQKKLKTK
jgi:hypothetical protein